MAVIGINSIFDFLNYLAVNHHPVIFGFFVILFCFIGLICLIPISYLFAYIGEYLQKIPYLDFLFVELDQWGDYKPNKQSRTHNQKIVPMSELEVEFLRLCQGNKALAKKLYSDMKQRYPDKGKDWWIKAIINDLRFERGHSPPQHTTKKSTTTPSKTIDSSPKTDGVLESKILRLLQGDRETAIRLLTNVKQRNPGQSYEWYLQKVLWDLERDRRI